MEDGLQTSDWLNIGFSVKTNYNKKTYIREPAREIETGTTTFEREVPV